MHQCIKEEKKCCIFIVWPCPRTRTFVPGAIKFTILVDTSLGIILKLSYLCLGVEKKILKEIMHFHCMPYMTMP